jgi:hypothetical protein
VGRGLPHPDTRHDRSSSKVQVQAPTCDGGSRRRKEKRRSAVLRRFGNSCNPHLLLMDGFSLRRAAVAEAKEPAANPPASPALPILHATSSTPALDPDRQDSRSRARTHRLRLRPSSRGRLISDPGVSGETWYSSERNGSMGVSSTVYALPAPTTDRRFPRLNRPGYKTPTLAPK